MKEKDIQWLIRTFDNKFPEMTGDNIKQVFYTPQSIKVFLLEFLKKLHERTN
jgi:hypothetical protein